MAVPRLRLHGAQSDVALPQPLAGGDVATIRRILTLQAQGRIPAADEAIAGLENPLLMGPVLAHRYLDTAHRSTDAELAGWLATFGDEPRAPAIHSLLLQRLPARVGPPAPPAVPTFTHPDSGDLLGEELLSAGDDITRSGDLDQSVSEAVERGDAKAAVQAINRAHGIDGRYAVRLRAEVTQGLFLRNRDAQALNVALAALRAGAAQNQVGFYGGLAAWRLKRLWLARTLFEAAAEGPNTPAVTRVAAALWAARASQRLNDAPAAAHWLGKAAAGPVTFHALVARRMLGMATDDQTRRELLSQADVDAVASEPGGKRAFALLQVGLHDQAEDELRLLAARAPRDAEFVRSLLRVAASVGFSDLTAELADRLVTDDGRTLPLPRLPIPRLRPAGGFDIDPPLVYALTRLESKFNPGAVSASGAQGLMQVMPVTARYLAGDREGYQPPLLNPAVNLEIGQRYLSYLARLREIRGNLIHVLAAYNSGPGLMMRWREDVRDHGDPLLFLEAIPVHQTRAFVTRALTFSWLYGARLHLPTPSLDALANGQFPRFTSTPAQRTMATVPPHL